MDGKRISFPEPDFLPHRNVTDPYRMLADEACLEQEKPWNVFLEFCIQNDILF